MSGSYGEDIRDVKRPYRKKAFQTGYSQKGAAVSSTPLPPHTYSTATTQQTEAMRPGVDTPFVVPSEPRPNLWTEAQQLLVRFIRGIHHLSQNRLTWFKDKK